MDPHAEPINFFDNGPIPPYDGCDYEESTARIVLLPDRDHGSVAFSVLILVEWGYRTFFNDEAQLVDEDRPVSQESESTSGIRRFLGVPKRQREVEPNR